MDAVALRRHASARLQRGLAPRVLVGRLLCDRDASGAVRLLDPSTGGELAAEDDRPAFVLSTEAEATDGNIVRQKWDLSRADEGGPGVPILWNHNANVLLGQWQDLEVQTLDAGPALVGRAWFDPEDPDAQRRKGQVKRGILNSTSIGWKPGGKVRRGELAEDDPLYRAPEDGPCGPEEGWVMGTDEEPNRLIETSMTPIPAQQEAVVIQRFWERGAEDLDMLLRTGGTADLDRVLAVLAAHPRVRAFLDHQVRVAVDEALKRHGATVAPIPLSAEEAAPTPTSQEEPRPRLTLVGDLFRKGA